MQLGTTVLCVGANRYTSQQQEQKLAFYKENNIKVPIKGQPYTVIGFIVLGDTLHYFLHELDQYINIDGISKRIVWNADMFIEVDAPPVPLIDVSKVFSKELSLTDNELRRLRAH